MKKYKCKYISGGGTEYDAGIWELKETPKTISFIYTGNLIFEPLYTLIKINKFYSKKKIRKDNNYSAYKEFEYGGQKYKSWCNNGHVVKDWLDGTFTAYPNQCGTPYYFEPINASKL